LKFGENEIVGGLTLEEGNGLEYNNTVEVFAFEYFPGSVIDEALEMIA
jgi:hypothetical protein